MEIYLDEHLCEKLNLSYYEGHKDLPEYAHIISLSVGSILHYRDFWDKMHRKIFAEYVLTGDRIRVIPAIGPGWYTLTNYPNTGDEPMHWRSNKKKSDKLIDILDDNENPNNVALIDNDARRSVEDQLYLAGIIENPEDGGLLG
jgi:hypothetical protein